MAFDYPSALRTYEAALARTKECLGAGDLYNGQIYLDKAIALAHKLEQNAIVNDFKVRFHTEGERLLKLSSLLKAGQNPFQKKEIPNVQGPDSASMKKEEESASSYFSKEAPTLTLEDVAGLEEVKKQIRLNVLLPLQNPDLYFRYKDETGCRILMYGPPGCGKSFVAEAIAGELKCAYAVITVSDILDKYVGVGPKKIKEIFDEAEHFDNCLLFFDEIDALGSSRDSDDSAHTKDILTAFLTSMSGFKPKGKSLKVVIAATNRPWALDSALIRGQRFDTQLYVGLPDEPAREFFVKKAFKKHPELLEGSDLSIDYMVSSLDGFAGADIKTILEKTKEKALDRALSNPNEKGYAIIEKNDFDEVLSEYRNPVTPDILMRFEAFSKGEI